MSATIPPSSPLKRALAAIERLEAKLEAVEGARREPIAIVGMGCRFPGGANDPDAFWRFLREGGDALTEIPPDRWDIDAYYDPDPDAPGKMASRWGAFLERVDGFDPQLFGITPREAAAMDPQQRLLLEVSWEALEHAGIAPDRLEGSPTGVFVGIVNSDYEQLCRGRHGLDEFGAYYASGNAHSVASGRLSYLLGLRGPALSLDTACSASLVAVHLAVGSLRAGECGLALAGGVNAILVPESSIAISKYRMLSPDGRCKTFDAAANGFARGEGCGVIVLKRLSDAVADGDRILALIRGTAVNQDGSSSGLTAPNGPAQAAVVQAALEDGGVSAADVTYVEAHGTGTSLGDPIEVQALASALRRQRDAARPVLIGSVKTNLGHLESAAGIAGLIKLVLCLQHREIPPHLHLRDPNPLIPWERLAVAVPRQLTAWPAGAPLVGGVSSFGFSGTNAHLVLAAAPELERPVSAYARPTHLLALSAGSGDALRELARRMEEHLAVHPEEAPGDVAHTANAGRAQLAHRLALRAESTAGMRARLRTWLDGDEASALLSGQVPPGDPPRVAFLFTGQGSQYVNMGQQLYSSQPIFRAALDRCDEILRPQLERPLLSILYPTAAEEAESARLLDRTAYTQPAMFALEYALCELWRSWGVEPVAVLGHSVGEYMAACAAGVFGLEDGLTLIAERGRLMQALPPGGAMAAVFTDVEAVEVALAPWSDQLGIAAVNGPANVVVSGDRAAVAEALERFEAGGIRSKRLRVSHAFHSPLMDPVMEPFAAAAADATFSEPRLRLVSNVSGRLATAAEIADPGYWVRHVREPVQFARGMAALRDEGVSLFVEIGPGTTLLGMGRHCIPEGAGVLVPSLRRGRDDWDQMLDGLASLYVSGVDVDWEGCDRPYGYRAVALPTYPFQRQRCWVSGSPRPLRSAASNGDAHPLLGRRLRSALPEVQYEVELAAASYGFIADHRVQDVSILPAAAYVELGLAAAAEHFGQAPGSGPLGVEDLVIGEPIAFHDGESRIVQTVVEPDTSFRVLSQAENGGGWSLHASGRLTANGIEPQGEPLEAIRERCPEPVTEDEHWRRMRAHGLDFGPAMHGVAEIRRADGEALARIRTPESVEAESSGFRLHPALLDACLQVLAAALPAGAPPDHYLPLSLDAFRFFRRPTGDLWSHVTLDSPAGPLPDTLRGDVRLLDETGSVIAEGTGLSLRRTASVPADAEVRDWLYEVEWRPAPRPADADTAHGTISAADLARSTAYGFLAAVERYGVDADDEAGVHLESLSAGYVIEAFQRLDCAFEPGRSFTSGQVAEECGVVDRYRRLLERLLDILAEEGILDREEGSGWKVLRRPEPLDLAERLNELLDRYPDSRAQIRLVGACGPHLAGALTGEVDPLSLLFPGGSTELAERLYRESPKARAFNILIREAIAEVAGNIAPGRSLRVLEIGAGTGGTSASVLPALPPEHTEYVFTDISPAFLTRAIERFDEYDFLRYEPLDIERNPASQGFAGREFDVILAVNVLHATADLSQTLAHVRSLLAPGGLLVLGEGTEPERWIDVTFGLTDGWWRYTDTDVRPAYPLLPPGRWIELLAEAGFADTAIAPADAERHGRAILLARAPAETEVRVGDWLVVGDESGVADRLAELLRQRGQNCLVAPAAGDGDASALDVLVRKAAADGERPLRGVIHLAALDARDPLVGDSLEPVQRAVCGSVIELMQALGRVAIEPPRLWLVTRGAQRIVGTDRTAVAQAPVWGLAAVLREEHPELRCVTVDLDPAAELDAVADALLRELWRPDGEDRIALRGETRYAARLVPSRVAPNGVAPPADAAAPVRLIASPDGVLDELAWTSAKRRAPAGGEVEIRVHATGLNFRDVLNALAMRDDHDPLGGECSGRVVAVGEGVTDLDVGDEVIAVATGGFASYVTLRSDLVLRKPKGLGFAEAAALPLAFLTAYYCLHRVARLAAGERILIHAAAGGVGLAAVRLALRAGAEIFATAGSPKKRAFLRSLGVLHVLDSRTLDFADGILELTGGQGVDVVLNSLAGEFIPRSLEALADAGRFLEIGKREIWTAEDVARVRPRAQYRIVDLAGRLHADPPSVRSVLREAMDVATSAEVEPLPITVFARSRVADAFRYMAQAEHIGKIVVMQDVADGENAPASSPAIRGDATYLITGGLGGLGLLTARWLAGRGAHSLVLMGRSSPSEEAGAAIREIEEAGARVMVVQGDVARADDLRKVLERIDRELPRLCGVVHSAGELEDGALLRQEWHKFARVLAPKVDGAWLLHTLTRDFPLDFFVMYSSIASILGSAGQGSHAAANAFLDALAHDRRARGLPALSIGWGVWSRIGSAAARGMEERVATRGVGAIAPEDGLTALELLLGSGRPHIVVQPVDWARYLDGTNETPRWLSEVAAEARERRPARPGPNGSTALRGAEAAEPPLVERWAAAPSDDQRELLMTHVHEQVVRVIGLGDGQSVDPRQPLSELGVDSLMAVELRNRLGSSLGTGSALPATLVFDHPTITALTDYLARNVLVLDCTVATTAAPAPPADLLDSIEQLSEEEVDRFFDGNGESRDA